MGQPEGQPEGAANFYWADLVFLNYKGAHGPARGASQARRQKGHQIPTGQIWGSLIIREPMGQPEGPARPEDKRANFYWADLVFLNYKGAHGPARGASQTRKQKSHQISTGQIWGSLIIREPMGQPEGPARPEDKRANFNWADLVFLNYKGAHGPARGASQTRRQKSHQISTGQIWGSLIIREPMGQPEGPARPEDKRTIKFLLGRFGVP